MYSSKTLSYITSLVIFAPKLPPIYHHVVNNSEQLEKDNFEINYLILR